MVNYKRVPYNNAAGDNGYRYLKEGKFIKESRVPHEVMDKFQYTPEIAYDDLPDKERCVFCEAPQSRQRYLNSEMVDLCEYHYQNMSLGRIAAQVRLLKEEKEKQDGIDATTQAKGKGKLKRSPRKDSVALNYTG